MIWLWREAAVGQQPGVVIQTRRIAAWLVESHLFVNSRRFWPFQVDRQLWLAVCNVSLSPVATTITTPHSLLWPHPPWVYHPPRPPPCLQFSNTHARLVSVCMHTDHSCAAQSRPHKPTAVRQHSLMRSRMSSPSTTLPNTTCLPARTSAAGTTMRNALRQAASAHLSTNTHNSDSLYSACLHTHHHTAAPARA